MTTPIIDNINLIAALAAPSLTWLTWAFIDWRRAKRKGRKS